MLLANLESEIIHLSRHMRDRAADPYTERKGAHLKRRFCALQFYGGWRVGPTGRRLGTVCNFTSSATLSPVAYFIGCRHESYR